MKMQLFKNYFTYEGTKKFRRLNVHSIAVDSGPTVLKELPPPPVFAISKYIIIIIWTRVCKGLLFLIILLFWWKMILKDITE